MDQLELRSITLPSTFQSFQELDVLCETLTIIDPLNIWRVTGLLQGRVASAGRFSGGSDPGAPPIGVVRTQHVGRDRVLPITSDLPYLPRLFRRMRE